MTNKHIQAAIERGPHVSAKDPKAAAYAWAEAQEKEEQGYCTIYEWEKIKGNHPPQLKLSPISAIPHKSRAYRLILDLSFGIKVGGKNGIYK